jgi:pimeloyl-ACP methyl ester carboxylesterase
MVLPRVLAFLGAGFITLLNGEPLAPPYRNHRDLLVWIDADGVERPVGTTEEWERRRIHIFLGMQQAMGPLPDRSKLVDIDVWETGRREESAYTRLTITFAAEPGDRVPAYLFVPKGGASGVRRPGIVALHQTSRFGKGAASGEDPNRNLAYAPELAERGYIVVAPDYPSFGDYTYDFNADGYVSGSMKGVFNHMRCVDLLCARSDVDPERIGAIGHSLGGHNAMFLGAFDRRVKAIVSSSGWTPFHDYYGGAIAGWTSDRYIPRLRDFYKLDPNLAPFDFYEVVGAFAPRAFFSVSPLRDDNFAVEGVRKAIAEARKVYRLYGAEERLQVRYPDAPHDFPAAERREAYGFLDRVLGRPSGP